MFKVKKICHTFLLFRIKWLNAHKDKYLRILKEMDEKEDADDGQQKIPRELVEEKQKDTMERLSIYQKNDIYCRKMILYVMLMYAILAYKKTDIRIPAELKSGWNGHNVALSYFIHKKVM